MTRPEVIVQFVEMDINQGEKEAFIHFWHQQDCTVKIRPKVSWGGRVDLPSHVDGNAKRWPCHWGMQSMAITDRGQVVTCAVDLDASFIAGDVTRQSLKEVWNGKLKALRQHHLTGQFDQLPSFCRNCPDWQFARADFYDLNT